MEADWRLLALFNVCLCKLLVPHCLFFVPDYIPSLLNEWIKLIFKPSLEYFLRILETYLLSRTRIINYRKLCRGSSKRTFKNKRLLQKDKLPKHKYKIFYTKNSIIWKEMQIYFNKFIKPIIKINSLIISCLFLVWYGFVHAI